MPRLGLHVLVAEDNPTNRAVVCGMLEQLACTFDEAADGRAAVNAALARRYDAILMDWQMPELDGLEAAAEIRAHEERTGEPRRRIVAVTANADANHRRRCLEHGMDAFVSKPLRLCALGEALGFVAPAVAKLDGTALADLTELDPTGELLRRVLGLFVTDAATSVGEMVASIAAGDRDGAGAAAHRLKSASAYVGATDLAELCASIEAAARSGDEPLSTFAPRIVASHSAAAAAVGALRGE